MINRFADARVFVVDDNPANVALLTAVLTRAGFANVATETDPRRVLPRLPEVDPDLIILDLHMPYLDGFEVLEQIRGFAPREYLPVLVLTADTTSAASQRALGAGAQDFVTKPFNNAEVVLRTQNLVEIRYLYTTLRGSIVRQNAEVERLQDLDGLKDILLQTVSHDLRSPISAVLAFTKLLAADAEAAQPLSVERRLAIIARIETSARKMDRLLRDLLDSDPMRKIPGHLVRCDVGDLVRRVVADVDLGRDHPLELDIQPVDMSIDPVHVERIVENLLANARQHVEPGVAIWVRTAPLDGGVLISVDDAGPGVAADLAQSIFEPFRRGPDPQSEGLGLGLSLVSRFARLHGGRAWVEERPGGGAAFRVVLPAPADDDDRDHDDDDDDDPAYRLAAVA